MGTPTREGENMRKELTPGQEIRRMAWFARHYDRVSDAGKTWMEDWIASKAAKRRGLIQ